MKEQLTCDCSSAAEIIEFWRNDMLKDKIVRIPLAGNAYLETKSHGGKITTGGISEWSDPEAVFGIYVRFNKNVKFDAAIRVRSQSSDSVIRFGTGEDHTDVTLEAGYHEVMLGSYEAGCDGYTRFELRGISKTGKYFASPSEILLYGVDEDDMASYISPVDRDNYYWTRRGPSVHCGYDTREFGDVEWFYNEVTVPEGYDPIGTYAMAIGFNGGYFGIQTNAANERRILFSIWSPHVTDDPSTIPEELRIVCLGKNERTHVGEFGGEGSGGQSYMKYMWKTGETYRFLMHVKPQGDNKTAYSAYFYFPESGKFELIASFLRPVTNTYLTGAHSFLENFSDTRGYITRMAYYGNQWAFTADGKWAAPTRIRFTGDTTARRGWRVDYDGGIAPDGRFFLKNGGFFSGSAVIDTVFERDTDGLTAPDFDPREI